MTFITCSANKDQVKKDEAAAHPQQNLDANLRKALLKALTELENEEITKIKSRNNMIFEKASAASLTFTANSLSTEKSTTTQVQDKPLIIVQKSNVVQSRPITSIETSNLDPLKDAENILVSASNTFSQSNKRSQDNLKASSNVNSIRNFVKTASINGPTTVRTATSLTTPSTTTTSTEESEAKVEDVQFFSAPLVAAFTVHQDERGLPKSVIPLYQQFQNKNRLENRSTLTPSQQELLRQQRIIEQQDILKKQDLIRQQELLKQQELLDQQELLKQQELREKEILKQQELLKQRETQKREELQRQQNLIRKNEKELKERQLHEEQLRAQLRLQEKQRKLEEEIRFLRQKQEQHEYLLRQQQLVHEKELREQKQKFFNEQFNAKDSQKNFVPVVTPVAIPAIGLLKPPVAPNPNKGGTIFAIQPSITVNPGALPLNAQILPIKNAIDFRQPFMQATTTIIPLIPVRQIPQHLTQQQPPLVSNVPNFNLIQSFQPIQSFQTQPNILPLQGNRVFRQETGTGNFFNSIQPASHAVQSSRSVSHHTSHNIVQPSDSFNQVNQPLNNFNTFVQPHFQNNRFFRSNLESTHMSPNNFNRGRSPVISQHLDNLLYNTGIYHGRQYEDLNIVSKVLSLNHLGSDHRFALSRKDEVEVHAPH